MIINPILFNTNSKIIAFDESLLSPIKYQDIFKSLNTISEIHNLYIIFSSHEKKYLQVLSTYFSMNVKLTGNRSILLIRIQEPKEEFKDIKWLDSNSDINKGIDEWENTIFEFKNIIIKKSISSALLDIYVKNIEDFIKNIALIIKAIEGAICDYFIDLGYLPVHSCLVSNKVNSILILGKSQNGKTTLAKKFEKLNYNILSDEYTFIRANSIIPYGHYLKKYINNNLLYINQNIELFKNINRSVSKIKNNFTPPDLDRIIVQQIHTNSNEIHTNLNKENNAKFLLPYLHNYPNEFFITKNISYNSIIDISHFLLHFPFEYRNNKYI